MVSSRPLACLVFGAAAWKCQDRDRFIGWTAEQRQKHLALVANNTRFLILPWVKVPDLGSWILGQVAGRIGRDWQAKYGHPVVLLETFVEQQRFRGTVYRAANWQSVGVTAGTVRQDRHTCLQVPRKDIYLYPLRRSFREALQRMKSPEELLREVAEHPERLVEYISALQEQLAAATGLQELEQPCRPKRSIDADQGGTSPEGAAVGPSPGAHRRAETGTLWRQGRQAQ